MGDENKGDAQALAQALQFHLHLLAELLVERAQRLVQKEHCRLEHESPRQRHALPLTPTQLMRIAVLFSGKLDHLENGTNSLEDFRRRQLLLLQAERHIAEDIQVGEERVVLEDGVHIAAVRR